MKPTLLSWLPACLILASAAQGQFHVNTHTTNSQTLPHIAQSENGNFVVVWSSYNQDGSSGGIFGQRFDSNCSPAGGEFRVNTATTGNQTEPAVAMNNTGSFVVVWEGPSVNTEDIFARRFDPNGKPLCDEFRVNTITAGKQLCPNVAMNNDGNFVVVWDSMDIPEAGKRAICGQLYDHNGLPTGTEFVVNNESSVCRYPDVAMLTTGKFMVVWLRESSSNSIWARSFESNGSAPFLATKVNDIEFTSLTRPAIATDSMGNYVIVWDGHYYNYLEDDIFIKRYHRTGAPIRPQFCVNTYKTGAQTDPSVAMNSDGEFVVVWQSDTESETTKKDIFGQRFPSQGEYSGDPILLGDQFRINTYTLDDQKCPDVAIGKNSKFITVWQSSGQDGSGYGIFGETGPKVGSADFTDNGFVNFGDYHVLAKEWLKENNPLKADLIDDNKIDQQDLAAFCQQWLTPRYDCSEADINSDGRIDFKDYSLLANNWLRQGPSLDGDITANGVVDLTDLQAMVFHWANGCK